MQALLRCTLFACAVGAVLLAWGTLGGVSYAQGTAARTGTGSGAVLRTLDKVSGEVIDVEMASGQTMAYGPLQVTLHECRYPANNRSGDAFGLIRVIDTRRIEELFAGWMVASSPGLNALEHSRYDVWLLRCMVSGD
ncbi:MAG: DUF2155 domain-containing protein [Pseudomonadota bacterium]